MSSQAQHRRTLSSPHPSAPVRALNRRTRSQRGLPRSSPKLEDQPKRVDVVDLEDDEDGSKENVQGGAGVETVNDKMVFTPTRNISDVEARMRRQLSALCTPENVNGHAVIYVGDADDEDSPVLVWEEVKRIGFVDLEDNDVKET